MNVFGISVGREDILSALLGSPAISIDPETGETQDNRSTDGFWRGSTGIQNTRVSGVMWTEGLNPWNLASRRLEFVPNPWAAFPVKDLGVPMSYLRHQDEFLVPEYGPTLGEQLGLPRGWPEEGELPVNDN